MAIRAINEGSEGKSYVFTKGDLAALDRARDDYGLTSNEGVLAFALGVLSQAKGTPLTITTGKSFAPAEHLEEHLEDE